MKRRSGGDCTIKLIVESSKKCKEEICLCIEKAEYTEKKISHAARALWTCIFASTVYPKRPPVTTLKTNTWGGKAFSFFFFFLRVPVHLLKAPCWEAGGSACNSCTVKSNCVLYLNLEATLLGSKQIRVPVDRCYSKQWSQGVLWAIPDPSIKRRCSDRFLVAVFTQLALQRAWLPRQTAAGSCRVNFAVALQLLCSCSALTYLPVPSGRLALPPLPAWNEPCWGCCSWVEGEPALGWW